MRRGISLMEVLISIGIMAIGMVSIASLIPAGGLQVQKATTEERKAELGLNAAKEFQIRGMAKPENWTHANGTVVQLADIVGGSPPVDGYNTPPVAIDPLMIAVGAAAVDNFPATTVSGAPTMKRLGLSFVNTRQLADVAFSITDELVTIQPEDRSSPARSPAKADMDEAEHRRPFEGNYTWMATITPLEYDPDAVTAAPGRTYKLSIAVFDRRPMVSPPQEQTMQATIATGSTGVDGGEFTLTSASLPTLESVKAGRWVLLSRNEPWSKNGTPQTPRPTFKWYRVTTATEPGPVGANFEMDVTLTGPDWNTTIAGQVYLNTFDGLVAIYERVIRLEGPSLWSSQ